ncbi:MAG: 30S ribosomal protein S6e [Halobacteriales archaeon]
MSLRVVVSDPETGTSYQVEADENRFNGRSIGDEVDGAAVGLDGATLEITGGSDDTGRPMRGDVEGPGINEVLVSGGTGFNPTRDGERRRVSVRGAEVGEATVQVNAVVIDSGGVDVEDELAGDEGDEDEAEDEE